MRLPKFIKNWKKFAHGKTRTHHLSISSQTRYRCATTHFRQSNDMNTSNSAKINQYFSENIKYWNSATQPVLKILLVYFPFTNPKSMRKVSYERHCDENKFRSENIRAAIFVAVVLIRDFQNIKNVYGWEPGTSQDATCSWHNRNV